MAASARPPLSGAVLARPSTRQIIIEEIRNHTTDVSNNATSHAGVSEAVATQRSLADPNAAIAPKASKGGQRLAHAAALRLAHAEGGRADVANSVHRRHQGWVRRKAGRVGPVDEVDAALPCEAAIDRVGREWKQRRGLL